MVDLESLARQLGEGIWLAPALAVVLAALLWAWRKSPGGSKRKPNSVRIRSEVTNGAAGQGHPRSAAQPRLRDDLRNRDLGTEDDPMDLVDHPLFILGADRRLRFCNGEARALLRELALAGDPIGRTLPEIAAETGNAALAELAAGEWPGLGRRTPIAVRRDGASTISYRLRTRQTTDSQIIELFDVSDEREKRRQALRQRESLRSILQTLPDVVVRIDRQGQILYYNRVPEGLAVELWRNANLYSFVSQTEHSQLRLAIDQVFAGKEIGEFSFLWERPGQPASYVLARLGPVMDGARVEAATVVLSDITVQMRAEIDAARREIQFHTVLESLPIAVRIFDARELKAKIDAFGLDAAGVLALNDQLATELGLGLKEIACNGRYNELFALPARQAPSAEDFRPEDWRNALERMRRATAAFLDGASECLIVQSDQTQNGRRRWIEARISLTAPDWSRIVSCLSDVTERETAARLTAAREQRYFQMIEALPLGVRVLDFSAVRKLLEKSGLGPADLRAVPRHEISELAMLVRDLESNEVSRRHEKLWRGVDVPDCALGIFGVEQFLNLVCRFLNGESEDIFELEMSAADPERIAGIQGAGLSAEHRPVKTVGLVHQVLEIRAVLLAEDWSRVAFLQSDLSERAERQAAALLQAREFETLFESSPLALQRIDLSAVQNRLQRMGARGIQDLLSYYWSKPRRILPLLGRVRLLDSNSAALRIFGPGAEQNFALKLNASSLETEALRSLALALISLFEGAPRVEATLAFGSTQGPSKHTAIIASPFPDRGMADILMVFQDVSELVNTAKALAESEMRARSILASLTDSVLALNEAGEIVFANDATPALFGYQTHELLGASLERLLVGFSREMMQRIALDAVPEDVAREVIGRRKDGRELFLQMAVALTQRSAPGSAAMVVILKDVSELTRYRRYLEEEVNDRTQQLSSALAREKDLHESLEVALLKERELGAMQRSFVSVVSHEFRTPLAVIQSSVDLLAQYRDRMSTEQQNSRLEKIQREVRHMAALMEDVFFFERTSAATLHLEPARLDLNEYLSEIINDCRLAAESDRHVHFHIRRESAIVFGWDLVIRRALSNLIANALKYGAGDTPIEVMVNGDADQLSIRVQNGGQIQPEIRDQIFDPFVRGRGPDHPPGTGLGLAIVRRAAEACNGDVRIIDFGPPQVVIEFVCPLTAAPLFGATMEALEVER